MNGPFRLGLKIKPIVVLQEVTGGLVEHIIAGTLHELHGLGGNYYDGIFVASAFCVLTAGESNLIDVHVGGIFGDIVALYRHRQRVGAALKLP